MASEAGTVSAMTSDTPSTTWSFESFLFGVLFTMGKESNSNNTTKPPKWPFLLVILDFLQMLAFFLKDTFHWHDLIGSWGHVIVFFQFNVPFQDRSDYLVWFWVATCLTLLAVGNVVFVGYNFLMHKFPYLWPIKTLRFVVSLFLRAFFVSLLGLFAESFACVGAQWMSLQAFPGSNCLEWPYALYGVIAILMVVVLCGLAFSSSLVYTEPNPTSRDVLAAADATFDFSFLVVESIMTLVSVLLVDFPVLMSVVYFVLSSILFGVCIVSLPCYKKIVTLMKGGFTGALALVSLLTIFVAVSQQREMLHSVLFFLFLPLGFLAGFAVTHYRLNTLINVHLCQRDTDSGKFRVPRFRTSYDVEIASRILREQQSAVVHEMMLAVFESAMQQFDDSARLHLIHANYLAAYHPLLVNEIEMEVEAARTLEPGFALRYSIYRKDREREQRRRSDDVGSDRMDLLSYIEFQKYYSSAKKFHLLSLRSLTCFWTTLRDSSDFVNDFSLAARRVYRAEAKAERYYRMLRNKYPNSSRVLRAYGYFLETMRNSPLAEDYYEKANELEDSLAKQHVANQTGVDSQSEKMIVTIDATGVIQTVNKAVLSNFGYKKDDLVGSNVSVLMPSPYKEQHQMYLQRYVNTGVARVMGRTRTVECQHKSGTCFAADLNLSKIPTETGDVFAGVLTKHKENSCVVTVDDRGIIKSVSTQFLDLFGYAHSSDLVGKSVSLCLPEEYLRFQTSASATADSSKSATVQARHSDGSSFAASVDVFRREEGKILLFTFRVVALQGTSAVAVVTIRADGTIISYNRLFTDMFGLSGDVTSQNISIIMGYPHNTKHNDYLKKYVETKESWIVGSPDGRLLEAQHTDGTSFDVNVRVEEFEVNGVTHFAGHITRVAASQVNAVEYRLFTDVHGNILTLNGASLALFGYDFSAIVGQNLRVLLPALPLVYEVPTTPLFLSNSPVWGRGSDGSFFGLKITLSEGEDKKFGIVLENVKEEELEGVVKPLEVALASVTSKPNTPDLSVRSILKDVGKKKSKPRVLSIEKSPRATPQRSPRTNTPSLGNTASRHMKSPRSPRLTPPSSPGLSSSVRFHELTIDDSMVSVPHSAPMSAQSPQEQVEPFFPANSDTSGSPDMVVQGSEDNAPAVILSPASSDGASDTACIDSVSHSVSQSPHSPVDQTDVASQSGASEGGSSQHSRASHALSSASSSTSARGRRRFFTTLSTAKHSTSVRSFLTRAKVSVVVVILMALLEIVVFSFVLSKHAGLLASTQVAANRVNLLLKATTTARELQNETYHQHTGEVARLKSDLATLHAAFTDLHHKLYLGSNGTDGIAGVHSLGEEQSQYYDRPSVGVHYHEFSPAWRVVGLWDAGRWFANSLLALSHANRTFDELGQDNSFRFIMANGAYNLYDLAERSLDSYLNGLNDYGWFSELVDLLLSAAVILGLFCVFMVFGPALTVVMHERMDAVLMFLQLPQHVVHALAARRVRFSEDSDEELASDDGSSSEGEENVVTKASKGHRKEVPLERHHDDPSHIARRRSSFEQVRRQSISLADAPPSPAKAGKRRGVRASLSSKATPVVSQFTLRKYQWALRLRCFLGLFLLALLFGAVPLLGHFSNDRDGRLVLAGKCQFLAKRIDFFAQEFMLSTTHACSQSPVFTMPFDVMQAHLRFNAMRLQKLHNTLLSAHKLEKGYHDIARDRVLETTRTSMLLGLPEDEYAPQLTDDLGFHVPSPELAQLYYRPHCLLANTSRCGPRSLAVDAPAFSQGLHALVRHFTEDALLLSEMCARNFTVMPTAAHTEAYAFIRKVIDVEIASGYKTSLDLFTQNTNAQINSCKQIQILLLSCAVLLSIGLYVVLFYPIARTINDEIVRVRLLLLLLPQQDVGSIEPVKRFLDAEYERLKDESS